MLYKKIFYGLLSTSHAMFLFKRARSLIYITIYEKENIVQCIFVIFNPYQIK